MSDETALLAAIVAFPDEDTPRLVYADWLQEDGQPDRAEFIRVQCEYARLHPHFEEHEDIGRSNCQLCRRGEELSSLLTGRFRIRRREAAPFAADCPYRLAMMGSYLGPMVEWDWHRGFICEVRCPAAWWVQHSGIMCERHPVANVQLLSWPEWKSDEDAVWFVGDPTGKRVLWLDVIAEMTPEERVARDSFHPLLRCRWRGIAVKLPPAPMPVFEVVRTFQIQVMTAERIEEIRAAVQTLNAEPMSGFPVADQRVRAACA